MPSDSSVNRGQNTGKGVQHNDAVSKQIARQDKPDRSTMRETIARLNRKRDK